VKVFAVTREKSSRAPSRDMLMSTNSKLPSAFEKSPRTESTRGTPRDSKVTPRMINNSDASSVRSKDKSSVKESRKDKEQIALEKKQSKRDKKDFEKVFVIFI
jgi:hypothetical protein